MFGKEKDNCYITIKISIKKAFSFTVVLYHSYPPKSQVNSSNILQGKNPQK